MMSSMGGKGLQKEENPLARAPDSTLTGNTSSLKSRLGSIQDRTQAEPRLINPVPLFIRVCLVQIKQKRRDLGIRLIFAATCLDKGGSIHSTRTPSERIVEIGVGCVLCTYHKTISRAEIGRLFLSVD
jgi:hypothetical protein